MSSIFGFWSRTGQPLPLPDLQAMGAALAYSASGAANFWQQGAVGLGQRQQIHTPEDEFERQPLVSADGAQVLVSDGRLNNRAELLAALAPAGSGSTLPDGEIMLLAYQRWGRAFLNHLNGVFALVIWDQQRQELFAARSPIVAPSLVYCQTATGFAFASMPRGLHALPGIQRRLNRDRVATFLTGVLYAPEETLYEGIHRLRSGYWLSVNRDGLQTAAYWRPDLERSLEFASEEETLAVFQELLTQSVAAALRSATPVGILLSGGLDSATVAARAASLLAQHGERLTAFTEAPAQGFSGAVLPGRYADETLLVEAIARRYPNLELNIRHVPNGFFLDDPESLFRHLDEPFRNTSNRVWYEALLQEASGRGLHTLLDGAQGNLTISRKSAGLLPELLRSGDWRQAWRQFGMPKQPVTEQLKLLLRTLVHLLPHPVAHTILAIQMQHSRAAMRPKTGLIHPAFAAELRLTERIAEANLAQAVLLRMGERHLMYEALNRQDIGMYLSGFQSRFGVSQRSPLADVRLAEFCLALPASQYQWDGIDRRLVRRGMADLLPPEVLHNRSRGLQAADWYQRLYESRPRLLQQLEQLEANSAAQQMLNLKRMRAMYDAMPPPNETDFAQLSPYRSRFEPAMLMGRFLIWVEEGT